MINTFIQEINTHLIFLGAIFIIIGDIIIKMDPKLINVLKRTIIEKELFSLKFTLLTLILLFTLQIAILELNTLFIVFSGYNS